MQDPPGDSENTNQIKTPSDIQETTRQDHDNNLIDLMLYVHYRMYPNMIYYNIHTSSGFNWAVDDREAYRFFVNQSLVDGVFRSTIMAIGNFAAGSGGASGSWR